MNFATSINDALQLDRIVFLGRTLSEYVKFFDLDLSQWQTAKILDCPAGAASFVAELHQMGIDAVACDIVFNFDATTLQAKGQADLAHVMERLTDVTHNYNWDFYQNIAKLTEYRQIALEKFLADYPNGCQAGRYIHTVLPKLPFSDRSFDLVLSANLLFLYSDCLDYAFHWQTILELYRVCSQEVRIYPLQGKDAQTYPLLNNLLNDLNQAGISAEVVNVPWEFLKGSNQMLRLWR
ncbi:class I SAM-dependent methyltransferase [Nostoc sp. FACHB-87]|uniref:class I SAM-dependent methyltransferase n=1 Tax=Nostocaceae TaxID=1162 RepID=UPI0016887664|nr:MULTISPECIES: class I SAM-dependent methyltransferase [Nostocaceae]MBD2457404.1 class I SAM-dependent methyltransferase [Nostoc sp. FACHB-87]MBD2476636.1 class I SAM-dependent methyltransferase [Anabaena sp. FACHB-83]